MNLSDLAPAANHLWQSTLCAGAAWLLTLALRRNRAAVRYWIWLAASAKFLVPFSLLVSLGGAFGWRTAVAVVHPQVRFVLEQAGQPFAAPATVARLAPAMPTDHLMAGAVLGVWLCGFLVVALSWLGWWRRIRAAIRTARPLELGAPIRTMSSGARLEPGVFGIRKPVLLLPEGIADRLTGAQLQVVVAHEMCHVRRRDNLTGAMHMVVEAIFWFHPVVWWIEARLIEERERACDEEVLKSAIDPQVYAEGILNVCKFYLESPVVCVSGITGSDLKRRIAEIMAPRAARRLDRKRRLLVAVVGAAALAGPVAIGVVSAPPGRAQRQDSPRMAFEVASG